MKIGKFILSLTVVALMGQSVWADSSSRGRVQLRRDETFEQNLRWEASADKAITPAKVLRWIQGFRGTALAVPSKTEFQPSFNAENGRVRFVAAIAIKF